MNVVILHGTEGSSRSNWFLWLAKQLRDAGHNLYVPDLPGANVPDFKVYNSFLKENLPFALNSDTILIGHSSGALAALALLQETRPTEPVKHVYLLGVFENDLEWEALRKVFTFPFDWLLLQALAEQICVIHSDNDPYIPLIQAEHIAAHLDAELLVLPGQKHFSGEGFSEFPWLLEKIKTDLAADAAPDPEHS